VSVMTTGEKHRASGPRTLHKYMNAQEYWDKEGARLLLDYDNHIPSIEERVKSAYNAGATDAYEKLLQLEREMERTRRDNFFRNHLNQTT